MNDLAEPFRRRMARETITEIYNKYAEYARSHALKQVVFCWHGGEPTLLGKETFRWMLEKQAECLGNGLQVRNLMQSNGTLFDDGMGGII